MSKEIKPKRRDFLFTATYTIGAVGLGAAIWPLVDQMNPDSSVKALSEQKNTSDKLLNKLASDHETFKTNIEELTSVGRKEEIARMLSGESITDQAREAAKSLQDNDE